MPLRISWAQPLRRKLPLLISVLLTVMVGAFLSYANDEIHEVVERSAGHRLTEASLRVARLLAESASQVHPRLVDAAQHPAVIRALRQARSGDPDVVRALAASAASGSRTMSWKLITRSCRELAHVGPRRDWPRCPPSGLNGVSEFYLHRDSVAYDVVAPVLGGDGETIGFLMTTSVLREGGADAVEGLIGMGVRLHVGNVSGSLWHDLVRAVEPPGQIPQYGVPFHSRLNGTPHFGVAQLIPATPWAVLVRAPHPAIAAPADQLLARLAIAALVVIVVGALAAYGISRHVTVPLAELRDAAAAIASGDYSRRLRSHRRDELGDVIGMFNSMADQVEATTEDLQAQALELEEQMDALIIAQRDSAAVHSLLDDVLASAPVGVAMFDRELRFLKVNAALAAMTGRREEDHTGKMPSIVAPGMGALLEPLLRDVMNDGMPITNRRRVSLDASGAKRHWLTSVFPVRNGDSSVEGAGVVVLDMTPQHELEERYLQAQKMEAVGRLAGGIAHDFNNLLTVILSYSALARETAGEQSDLSEALDEIQGAGQRAAGLTRQLLSFSRAQVLEPRTVNLNAVVRGMERMLRRLIGEDVALELWLAEDVWHVHADPGQIEQVLMNLVVNARDAMPHGGQIAIETHNVAFSSELSAEIGADAGDYVTLVVADTGTGMSWDVQRHLFEPFFTTKEPGRGTGLGMATVYGIVKQSDGDIHVSSAPGQGTRITVYLPVQRDAGEAVPHRPRTPVTGGSETILLLEDDPALQTLASRILRRLGYHVLDARTPKQAIELARGYQGSIEALLTDVVMPDMNGAAVAEAVRTVRPQIRTIFMSGYTEDEVLRRGVSSDARHFLQKPFTPTELAHKIRQSLDASA